MNRNIGNNRKEKKVIKAQEKIRNIKGKTKQLHKRISNLIMQIWNQKNY